MLIALVIIGVIAAMTMAIIIPKVNEEQTVSRIRKAFSVFSQAYARAYITDGPIELWDIGTQDSEYGASELYNYFTKHIVKAKDCGTERDCFYEGDYTALNGKTRWEWHPRLHQHYARGILVDGTSYAFWSAGTGCKMNADINNEPGYMYSNVCGAIYVDINGYRKPNRAGYDLFVFTLTKDGVKPAGLERYKSPYGDKCKFGDASSTNGNACSGWILREGNMDYTRRHVS